MKIIGILLIFFCCAGSGIYAGYHVKHQVRICSRLLHLLEDCMIYIRYQNLPLPELFDLLAGIYPDFDFLRNLQFSCDSLPEQVWEQALQECDLPDDARKLLLSLGCELGKSDMQGQLSVLELYRMQMQNLLETYQADCGKKCHLFRSLGWLGGAMLTVLLI